MTVQIMIMIAIGMATDEAPIRSGEPDNGRCSVTALNQAMRATQRWRSALSSQTNEACWT